MNPARSIIGTTHHVRIAPPVNSTSTIFIAASIEIMEIMDMPMAVLKAIFKGIWCDNITVSSTIDVSKPLMMASVIIAKVGQGMPVNWKNAIVPKSPMAQPSKHHVVFLAARRHVCRHFQLIASGWARAIMSHILFPSNILSSNWKVKGQIGVIL